MPYRGDTQNKFFVGKQGDRVVLLRPPMPGQALRREDAQNLAAWLVVCSGCTLPEMVEVLEKVTKE